MKKLLLFLALLASQCGHFTYAQADKDLKFNINESGSHWFKFTFLNQTWIRYNQSNPGSTVNGTPKDNTFDIGLRRTRIQLFGQVADRVFVYTQFGMNNFNRVSSRKVGAFFHDATCEYQAIPGKLDLGAGLTGWTGMSRFSAPSIGTILGADAPLFAQATNDATDQFVRKLTVYAKGEVGKLSYRVGIADPLNVDKGSAPTNPSVNSTYANAANSIQPNAYIYYQFWDKEGTSTPYLRGSWLGQKKVLNLGAGLVQQSKAMWHLGSSGDTLRSDMLLWAVDAYLDLPLNAERKDAISAYAGYFNYQFGPGYLRNVGPMNPADGTIPTLASLNGAGSNSPIIGTGNILYAQAGYKFKEGLLGKQGTLQPYGQVEYAQFDRLADPMVMWDIGMNWLVDGHRAKLSLNYQSRPVYAPDTNGENRVTERKGLAFLQFQVSI